MKTFTKLFGSLLVFVYHCFDRIVIHGYLSGLSRPDQVISSARWSVCRLWTRLSLATHRRLPEVGGGYACNHKIPIEWAEKGVRKEDYVLPHLRRLVKKNAYKSTSSLKAWN